MKEKDMVDEEHYDVYYFKVATMKETNAQFQEALAIYRYSQAPLTPTLVYAISSLFLY
jgi:hypothetical protein